MSNATGVEQRCDAPLCENQGELKPCRDDEGVLLNLCSTCRSEFPVEVLDR